MIIPHPVNLTGIFLVVGGIAVTVAVNRALLRGKTSLQPYEMPKQLIISGPFRKSRNPLYVGMMAAVVGAVVIMGSLSSFIAPPLFFVFIDRYVIPFEEAALVKMFGDEYLDYKNKVRRWV